MIFHDLNIYVGENIRVVKVALRSFLVNSQNVSYTFDVHVYTYNGVCVSLRFNNIHSLVKRLQSRCYPTFSAINVYIFICSLSDLGTLQFVITTNKCPSAFASVCS